MICNLENIEQIDTKKFGQKIFYLKQIQDSNLLVNETIIVSNDVFKNYLNDTNETRSFPDIYSLIPLQFKNSVYLSIKTSLYCENIGILDNIKCINEEGSFNNAIKAIYESWSCDKAKANRITHFLDEVNTYPALFIQNYFDNIFSLVSRCPKNGEITNSENSENVGNSFFEINQSVKHFIIKIENALGFPAHIYFTDANQLIVCSVKKETMTDFAFLNSVLDLYKNKNISDLQLVLQLNPNQIFKYAITGKYIKINGIACSHGVSHGKLCFPNSKISNNDNYILGSDNEVRVDNSILRICVGAFTSFEIKHSHIEIACSRLKKPCVTHLKSIKINTKKKTITINQTIFHEFCYVFINGTLGEVFFSNEPFKYKPNYNGKLSDEYANLIMQIINKYTSNLELLKSLSVENQCQISLLKHELLKMEIE